MDFSYIVDRLKVKYDVSKSEDLIPPVIPVQKEFNQEPKDEILNWTVEIPPFSIPKKVLRTVIVLTSMFSLFLILAQDWIYLIVVLSIAFFANVILSYGVKTLNYKVFSNGVKLNETFYTWDKFNYYFIYEGQSDLIVITTKEYLPGRLYVYLKPSDLEKINQTLHTYLPKNPRHIKDVYEHVLFTFKPYLNLTDDN